VAVGESTEARLASLTNAAGEDIPQVYATWAGITLGDPSLEEALRQRLVVTGHTANQKESVEATVRKGGGTGESLEQMLRKTGLTGLS
jgi:hypothetical protein